MGIEKRENSGKSLKKKICCSDVHRNTVKRFVSIKVRPKVLRGFLCLVKLDSAKCQGGFKINKSIVFRVYAMFSKDPC
jgi:hypothetical protein